MKYLAIKIICETSKKAIMEGLGYEKLLSRMYMTSYDEIWNDEL